MSDLTALNSGSREAILNRLRAVQNDAPAVNFTPVPAPRPTPVSDLKTQFLQAALAGSSTVEEVAGRHEVPAAVQRYLEGEGLPKAAALWAEFRELDWASAGITVAVRAANGDDAVGITGVGCAIAETGTLVVLSGPDTAATTSLLPATHIAVVRLSSLVPGMEEALARIKTEQGALPRAVNLISGPSRTGDIEQTIVLGAHGPSRVHLILVENDE